jgi:hypothetical protein
MAKYGVRAVLFFTGAHSEDPTYDVESQYRRTPLIGDIIMHAWFCMTAPEWEYMLICWFDKGISKDGVDALESMGNKALFTVGKAIKGKKRCQKITSHSCNST